MKNQKNSLKKIIEMYNNIDINEDNYSIGGGLDSVKFASRRHEDAKCDAGKLTLGEATQLFKKATSEDINTVREVIEYAVPNMEWHHAGKLPKAYGGGMKKTYFINANEIVAIATNWNDLIEKLRISKENAKKEAEEKRTKEAIQHDFLKKNATYISRVTSRPAFFYETDREMNGKYGWFSSYGKSYNMTEYYSGWSFENEELLKKFLEL